ncbi:LysE family translocator [Dongia sp.]|uniref:LysE family translocator n=1 Tax=Dongia sp. TaxID=1977262 RepID=UPI0035B19142
MENLASFIVAAVALTGSPGPATLGLAAAGAAFGLRRAFLLMVGIVIGVIAVMALTASGVVGLVLAQPLLGTAVAILAALYMLYLAWRIATAPPLSSQATGAATPGLGQGVFLGLGNPKAYAAMAALFSGFTLLPASPWADAAAKGGVVTAIVILVNIAWVVLGSSLTRHLHTPRLARAINMLFALALVVSVALTLFL